MKHVILVFCKTFETLTLLIYEKLSRNKIIEITKKHSKNKKLNKNK